MSLNHRKTVVYRLTQVARACRARSGAQLAVVGLHPGQESVLKALSESDGQSMSALAASLAVQPPTVTKMVSRLAAQGLVERRAAEGDGRQAQVFLTEDGRGKVADIDRIVKRVERQALTGIPEKDRKRLKKLLRAVERNLQPPRPGQADATQPPSAASIALEEV